MGTLLWIHKRRFAREYLLVLQFPINVHRVLSKKDINGRFVVPLPGQSIPTEHRTGHKFDTI